MKTLLSLPFVSKMVNHELGAVVTAAVGFIVGAFFAALSHWLHWTVDPAQQMQVDAALVLFFTTAANGALHYYQTGDKKELQRALGFTGDNVDGRIGDVTKAVAAYATQPVAATAQVRRAILEDDDARQHLFSQHP